MGVANSTSFRGTVLILVSITVASSSSFARQLLFSNQVPPQQVRQLAQDLGNDLSLVDAEDVNAVMGIANLSDKSLKQWLLSRIGYVIGEAEDQSERVKDLGPAKYSNSIFPQIEKPDPSGPDPEANSKGPQAPGRGRIVTVMANVGAGYYAAGKEHSVLLGYAFTSNRGNALIRLTSPRVGLLKIGQGLFGILPMRSNPQSIVNTWFRLSTLFHEAHHSDGNGASLTFSHAFCPKGHRYYNHPACDREANGPYAVEMLLVRQARLTCTQKGTCNAEEIEKLKYFEVDSRSRILDGRVLDPRPESISGGVTPGV